MKKEPKKNDTGNSRYLISLVEKIFLEPPYEEEENMGYLTPAEFEDQMNAIKKKYSDSPEMFHIEADRLICEVLKSQGYEAGVKIFENTRKWYS